MQVIGPRLHLPLIRHGQPVLRPRKPLHAVELYRRHAHHRKWMLVEFDGRPDDAPIGMERASPQGIAQHHIRRGAGAMLVCRVKEPPYLRLHAQQIEIIAGYLIAGELAHRVMPAQFHSRVSINPGHPAEGGVALAIIFKRGIRMRQELSSRPRHVAQLIEALWVGHSERPQQNRIQHAEDDDVGANAQHQSDGGYDRECWRPAQHAQRITNIEQQVLQKWQARFGVVAFPNRLHCAELQAGVAACFVVRHAGADVLLRLGRYMRFHLFPKT